MTPPPSALLPWPLRLQPGDDLRAALVAAVAAQGAGAAFVLAGIGSLSATRLRLAGAEEPIEVAGDVEILSLSGSIAADGGAHLHISTADSGGRVLGGHVAPGCLVRTTAELLIALLPGWRFSREFDAVTGYAELAMRPSST
jgi:predicted DNA-binding protein with PD1-like motif